MGFHQTKTHRSGKHSYHQIGLVRGQFGDIPEDTWLDFLAKNGFDGWEEASWELDLPQCDTESGAEIMHMAENGFCEHGEQESMLANGETEIGGRLPVNTDDLHHLSVYLFRAAAQPFFR